MDNKGRRVVKQFKISSKKIYPGGVWQRSSNANHESGWYFKKSTRTPHEFIFEDYKLIQEAVEYDVAKEAKFRPSGTPETTPDSFQEWFQSKYFGFVTSRIYIGSMSIEDITQDFSYTYAPLSWSDLDQKEQVTDITENWKISP